MSYTHEQFSRKTQRWAENTEFSTTYSGMVLAEMKELPCTKSFWQFCFKQIQCSFMELLSFSAFLNLFKYIALSNAYKLADTYQNYRCFNLGELLHLVRINSRLEKMQPAFFYVPINIYTHISSHICAYYTLTIYTYNSNLLFYSNIHYLCMFLEIVTFIKIVTHNFSVIFISQIWCLKIMK